MAEQNEDSNCLERYIYTFADLSAYVDRVLSQAAQAGLARDEGTMHNLVLGLFTQLNVEERRLMTFVSERYTDEQWKELQRVAEGAAAKGQAIASDAMAALDHEEVV